MTLGWALLVALAAGFAGGLAAGSAGRFVRRGLERHRSRRGTPIPTQDRVSSADDAVTQLDVANIRRDLQAVKGAVEQVHAEVSMLAGRLTKPAEERPTMPTPARPRFAPPPTRADTWPAATPPREAEIEPVVPPAVAAAEPAPIAVAPPTNAIRVEARDDRLVASSSYPPEAWLEPRGPASGQLTLNPNVTLNEYSLRRLSTFFHWEAERPGAMYETVRPAQIQWDEGRRTGTVIERGTARPR